MNIFYGVFQNLSPVAPFVNARFPGRAAVTDGGRFLVYNKEGSGTLCFNVCIVTRPGLYVLAPWMQARIYNVAAAAQFAPISKRPDSDYFLYSPYAVADPSGLPCY
jgi:hypothetical protein